MWYLQTSRRLSARLRLANPFWFSLFAGTTAFALYTCVYGLRKAFAVGAFDDHEYLGISYKVWMVTFQVMGYALSKFIGIRVISEQKKSKRLRSILVMSAMAAVSWFGFAVTVPPYNLIFLFTNGVPLGLIWGLIFSYLEGRTTTEVLGAGLSISFIFSAGFAKTVGAWLMVDAGVGETWMPLVAAGVFFGPLLLFAWLLDQLPRPSAEDERQRCKRTPMTKEQRLGFINRFLPGILLFVFTYMLLTSLRDFRDNFAAEIWTSLGRGDSAEIFTATEIPISLAVLVIMGSLIYIRDNKLALAINHVIILTGLVIIGLSTWLFQTQLIGDVTWMTLLGLGLYMGYVPFNCIFFERLLAAFRYVGTVGFIMYVADAFGYLSSVAVLFYKEFGFHQMSWLEFLVRSAYIVAGAGSTLITCSWLYFKMKGKVKIQKLANTSLATNA